MSADLDTEHPPASFRQYCSAEMNDDGTLTVSCALRDRRTGEILHFEETMDPRPIARVIAQNLMAMSGEGSIGGLGSFLSKAKNAAVKVASSAGIKKIWKQVSPVVKELAKEVPGGGTAIALAMKTADTVSAARKGSKGALDTLKKAAVKAANGNELAAEVMKTAKTLNTMMDIKEGKDSPDLARRLALIERTLSPLIPNPNPVPVSPFKVSGTIDLIGRKHVKNINNSMVRKALAKKQAKQAKQRGHGGVVQANRPVGRPVPLAVTKQFPVAAPAPDPVPDEEYLDDGTYSEDYPDDSRYNDEDYGADIAGWHEWMYNRPYRTPLSAAAQGDVGLGMSLRSLYANGLQTIAAMSK